MNENEAKENGVILSFQEDGVLYVYANVEEAIRAIEPLDATETFRFTYDQNGQPFVIDWISPNKETRKLFGIGFAENGEYKLIPKGSLDPKGLIRCIQNAVAIDPADKKPVIMKLAEQLSSCND